MTAALSSNIISEEKIQVRYSDIDFDKSLKPFSLLNFFQDIASDNAERLGFGYSKIYPQNLMWVLLKYRIEFVCCNGCIANNLSCGRTPKKRTVISRAFNIKSALNSTLFWWRCGDLDPGPNAYIRHFLHA